MTWVKLRDKKRPDAVVWLFNTHFDHRGAEARRQSALLLRKRLEALDPSEPWIVTGDFNCPEGSPPYEELVGETSDALTVVDSYRAVHHARGENEGTFNAWGERRSTARIDWILHSPRFDTVSAAIDRTEEGGRFPSDHYPVTAVLRWKD